MSTPRLAALASAILLLASYVTPARSDVLWGQDAAGWAFGTTEAGENGRGLLIAPDGTRYVFNDRRVFLSRDYDFICVRWLDWHEECVPRYETDCYRGLTNFDIDPFVFALLLGVPDECGGFVYTSGDIDPFVTLLVNAP